MKYLGGKSRIVKYILPLILKVPSKNYYEPFVGGGSVISQVPKYYNRIGSDINPRTILALEFIRDNLDQIPKDSAEFYEDDYKKLKLEGKMDGLTSYVNFVLSFGANGFPKGFAKNKANRDYVKEGYNNAIKQSKLLKDVILINKSYDQIQYEPNSIIYCDPPYKESGHHYSQIDKFDNDKFWQWCRDKVKEGHYVYISETKAPNDFVCIWSKELKSTINAKRSVVSRIDKLFIHKSQVHLRKGTL